MTEYKIVTPLDRRKGNSAILTLPWFVQQSRYRPEQSTFYPLVNGEEAFGAVYDALLKARKSVDIICWGFQPSMYFRRGYSDESLPIGQLLAQLGAKGIAVRLLCWSDALQVAATSENNMPGRTGWDAPYTVETQRQFDKAWYRRARDVSVRAVRIHRPVAYNLETFSGIELATRDFNLGDRCEIAWRTTMNGLDITRSRGEKLMGAVAMGLGIPTHHQKMVLVDYEEPEHAVGFVMGHNMLDEYWDTDAHSALRMHPQRGRCGMRPRQDISSRVTGPVLANLNENFCLAWDDATGQALHEARQHLADWLPLHRDRDTPVMSQVVRTQSQFGEFDIEKMYMQAVNNATQYIYIENQYFRFPPLAEKIRDAAMKQVEWGRDPGKHGPIHLFVVTNASDDGIGPGTVNTYRMLDALGRAETMPVVAQLERQDDRRDAYRKATKATREARSQLAQAYQSQHYIPPDIYQTQLAEARTQLKDAQAEQDRLHALMDEAPGPVTPEDIPGLKVHVCSLVAPDSPPGQWEPVYIHSKLMIVDDVFTTLGSANINTRSMEADSELNIMHERHDVSLPLRLRLWGMHTKGEGAQVDVAEAFKQWDVIIRRNSRRTKRGLAMPYAPIISFFYTGTKRSILD